jgi:hypothetical protein
VDPGARRHELVLEHALGFGGGVVDPTADHERRVVGRNAPRDAFHHQERTPEELRVGDVLDDAGHGHDVVGAQHLHDPTL